MTSEHSPIDPSQLSAEAQRALASPTTRMMAARGMAPLANPVDLLTVLYLLVFDSDGKVRDAASASLSELPDRLLAGGLSDASTDYRVLDFFASRLGDRRDLLERIILNPATSDETVAWLAKNTEDDKLIDLVSQNEQRILRHPAIIEAMYTNRNARMSTVDRVVELAVRNEVKVHGIAAWDEIARGILQSGKDGELTLSDDEKDALFAVAARVNAGREGSDDVAQSEADALVEEPKPQQVSIRDLSVPMKMRLATLGTKFDRAFLIRDTKKMVAMAAIKAPGVSESEVVKFAGNHSLIEDVIAYISTRREWVKQYGTKVALVQNPKTPLPTAMRLMTHLREKDIRVIARSRGVPSALSAQARKLMAQRSSGGKK